LRDAAERHGLTFGPDPATHDHATLGGMTGNNSCGTHSVLAPHRGPAYLCRPDAGGLLLGGPGHHRVPGRPARAADAREG
ncbi:MAG TPA: FAD-binding protein, partial [Streptosporangiaceae bacterium]|nr:FAD-binding protein [Streptosporangiaceae bacterium]